MKSRRTLLSLLGLLLATQASAQPQTLNFWGVNAQRQGVYNFNGTTWTLTPGPMKQVSVAADGSIWAIDLANGPGGGNVFFWNRSAWQQIPGQLTQISAGSAQNVWGVNAQNGVFRWDGAQWTMLPGLMKQVSAASDGSAWAIDLADGELGGNLFFWTGSVWQQIPGQFIQISAGSAQNVWGINKTNRVYRWDGTQYFDMQGLFKQVSVGADGTAWAIDLSAGAQGLGGYVFYWTGSAWQQSPGELVQIAVAPPGRIEDDSPALQYQGTWTKQTDTGASGGGYKVSGTPGNTLTFTFSGDSIAIYRPLDGNGGQADVTIDGKPRGSLYFYFQEQRMQVPAVLDRLGSGQHTLVLTVSPNKPQGSNGTNVYVDFISVPAPFFPSADQQAALTRVNYYRNLTGLPLAGPAGALDLVAQAHADYNATTGVLGHVETPATKGFIGVNPGDRMNYFGYDSSSSEDAYSGTDVVGSVDGWMATVYHRNPIMAFGNTDIGYGLSRLNGKLMTVLDFGIKSSSAPTDRVLTTYPINGQTNIPNSWDGNEGPDPLPGKTKPVGCPISLHIAQSANNPPAQSPGANLGELFDANNQPVPIYFRDSISDPAKFLNKDTFFVIPQQPLNLNATYRAHIMGWDSNGVAFDVTWSFTTVPAATISGVQAFSVTSDTAWIGWATAGPVTSTFVEYGTTKAYGSQAPVNNPGNSPNSYVGWLHGLPPNTTYHFRVKAQDALGKTATTGDYTFVTSAVTAPLAEVSHFVN